VSAHQATREIEIVIARTDVVVSCVTCIQLELLSTSKSFPETAVSLSERQTTDVASTDSVNDVHDTVHTPDRQWQQSADHDQPPVAMFVNEPFGRHAGPL
jgi:hypothetical protein